MGGCVVGGNGGGVSDRSYVVMTNSCKRAGVGSGSWINRVYVE